MKRKIITKLKSLKPKVRHVINVGLIILRMTPVAQQKKQNVLIGHFKCISKTK